jgi:formylglycine-generating enzyme required for sulfatase activity
MRCWSLFAFAFAVLLGVAQAQEPAESRVFVLVVGVEDYADPKITDLAYTEDDAQAVYDFFAKSPRSPTIASRVKLLRGKKATRIGVLREIRDHLVRKAVGPGDTAILYFAGHGFADADGTYLAAQDTQLDDLQFSAIAWPELQRVWSKIAAGRRVFLADACHSGGLAGLRGFGGISKAGSLPLKKAPSRASVLIAATGANQLSVEDKKRKHGVFTASLLDGLGGAADTNRDSTVSLGELSAYLKLQVPQLAKQAGGNQAPIVSIRGSEAFAWRLVLGSGHRRVSASPGYAKALERAKRLKGFSYLDTKSYNCGDQSFKIARFSHAKTGLMFHLVPGGSYMRGSTTGEANEKPIVKVTIQPFLICATECTQLAWQRVTGKNPSKFKGARRPVEQVTWNDTQVYVKAAGLRLPSEAEWEYASRAGSTRRFCFGDNEDDLKRYAVCQSMSRATWDVGGKLPNAFGLFDVHGNVLEWCQDTYVDNYSGAPTDGSARDDAGASAWVLRGGCFLNGAERCRPTFRNRGKAGFKFNVLGFRPAKSLP